jgi:hypothetical protein
MVNFCPSSVSYLFLHPAARNVYAVFAILDLDRVSYSLDESWIWHFPERQILICLRLFCVSCTVSQI